MEKKVILCYLFIVQYCVLVLPTYIMIFLLVSHYNFVAWESGFFVNNHFSRQMSFNTVICM